MTREVKDFLYAWSQKRKMHPPKYSQIKASKSLIITTEVTIKDLSGTTGVGEGKSWKMAGTLAALDLCKKLIANGIMSIDELSSRQPSSKSPEQKAGSKRKATDSKRNDHDRDYHRRDGHDSPKGNKRMRLERAELSDHSNGHHHDEVEEEVDAHRSVDDYHKLPRGAIGDHHKTDHAAIDDHQKSGMNATTTVSTSSNGKQVNCHHHYFQNAGVPPPVMSSFDDKDIPKRRLHDAILEHYHRNRQSTAIFQWKLCALEHLSTLLEQQFPNFRLFPFGSTVTGLGSYNSDMDVCLVVSEGDEIPENSKSYAKSMLNKARRVLRRSHHVRSIDLVPAKVPILRLKYADGSALMEIDINCNHLGGVRNSHLLHYYAKVDERFPALVLVVKHWAVVNGINDASTGTMSSYCLTMLVIHYLQHGLTRAVYPTPKPLLPNLQELFPAIFSADSDVRSLKLFETLPIPPENSSQHCQLSLTDLLLGFFNYYANYFDFHKWVPSIRIGGLLPNKKSTYAQFKDKLIAIEEPFEGINVARSITCPTKYLKITQAFETAYQKLRRHLTLDSIGVKLY